VYSCSEKKSGQVLICRIGPFPCQFHEVSKLISIKCAVVEHVSKCSLRDLITLAGSECNIARYQSNSEGTILSMR
jgi:hypothetical protein